MSIQTTPSLAELTYNILNTVRGRYNNDDVITREQVEFLIHSTRSMLIRQELNKGATTDSYIVQDLGCVEIEKIDASESTNIEVGCSLYRTKQQIPSTVETRYNQLFTRVGPINKIAQPYSKLSYDTVGYIEFSKFKTKDIKWFTKDNDGYIYISFPNNILPFLKYINVQGVFENPTEASKFFECDTNKTCYDYNMAYPIKYWMVDTITQIIIDKFIKPESLTNKDDTNDSNSTFTPTNKTE
jgi:hypothetical protein